MRFRAEVLPEDLSEKLIVYQDIVVTENRINFLVNRFPQPVERVSAGFFELNINRLNVGVPLQLLQNRPDIRQAERDLAATGLDVKVARINFFPQLVLSGGTGLQTFVINHLFEPQAVIGSIAGGLVGPLVNKRAIRAQYLTANARQLQAVYNYQRVILNAFTEVTNRLSMVEKFTESINIKKQQLRALEASVEVASDLFQNARTEYIDVLFAQRDLRDARMVLIDTKSEQLSAIVNTYQALGGGLTSIPNREDVPAPGPFIHTVREGETFRSISQLYYESERYYKALWAANKQTVPDPDGLAAGDKIIIPRADQLDQTLIDVGPALRLGLPRPPSTAAPTTNRPFRPRPRLRHPQSCLAPSARRGPKTPPSKPPVAPNPARPRRRRRRRGSDQMMHSWCHRNRPAFTRPREIRRDVSVLRVTRIRLIRTEDDVEEHAHVSVRLDRMPQGAVQVHLVAISPPFARAGEITSLLEVGHESLWTAAP